MKVLSNNQKARIRNRKEQIYNWKIKKVNLYEAIKEYEAKANIWGNMIKDYEKEIEKLEAEIEEIQNIKE